MTFISRTLEALKKVLAREREGVIVTRRAQPESPTASAPHQSRTVDDVAAPIPAARVRTPMATPVAAPRQAPVVPSTGTVPSMAAMENPAVAPTPPERSGSSEFDTLLADLGATYEEPTAEAIIARKDAEIAELRKNLLALRPMGDELAEANKAVLANEAASTEELAETRARLADERVRAVARKERLLGKLRSIAGRHAELQAQCDELGTRLRRAEGDLKRTRGWHHKAKARAEEKNRVAADRWREILRLRREIRDLRKRLDLPG